MFPSHVLCISKYGLQSGEGWKSFCSASNLSILHGLVFLFGLQRLLLIAKYFSNPTVKAFLGPTQTGLLEEVGRAGDGDGVRCEAYFRGTCPWDPAGVTSILMKLMVR